MLAIFGLVIARSSSIYPRNGPVGLDLHAAGRFSIGLWVYRGGGRLLIPSLIAASCVLYVAVYIGVDYLAALRLNVRATRSSGWTVILMIYCFFASVLPVWVLLQPRDYHQQPPVGGRPGLLILGMPVAGRRRAMRIS